MIIDPPKTLVSTAAVGVGSDVLFGLLRKMLNKHFTMAADEHREGASDSSVKRHYDEANAAENEFRAALAEVIADKERLNWLDQTHGVTLNQHGEANIVRFEYPFLGELRPAIDAAMRGPNTSGQPRPTEKGQSL